MSLFVNLERCVVPVHVCAVFALKKSSKQTQNSLNPARKVGEQCRFVGNQENWGKKGVERGPVMVMQGYSHPWLHNYGSVPIGSTIQGFKSDFLGPPE